jgi:hypothetical protein
VWWHESRVCDPISARLARRHAAAWGVALPHRTRRRTPTWWSASSSSSGTLSQWCEPRQDGTGRIPTMQGRTRWCKVEPGDARPDLVGARPDPVDTRKIRVVELNELHPVLRSCKISPSPSLVIRIWSFLEFLIRFDSPFRFQVRDLRHTLPPTS